MSEVTRTYRLIEYNLQFFGDDKTEEPTSKKLSDTRKKGQVAKSQELAHAIQLVGMFVMIRAFSAAMGGRFINVFSWIYGSVMDDLMTTEKGGFRVETIGLLLSNVYFQMFMLVVPFVVGGFVVAALSTGLQFKFQITTDPLKPKLSKFNPVNGVKRIFSVRSLFNLFLSIVKITLIGIIAYTAVVGHLNELFLLYELSLNQAVALIGDLVVSTGLRISLVYLVVGIADLLFQRWKFKSEIKMTKQEVKDEYKNAEGDPQIKGKQRQRMREVSMRRMMQSVPTADVVITNPEHLAVAIKYDPEVADAPVVLAKGADYLAQKIKEAAKENKVDIVENKPLARAIYTTVEVGQEIPPELYEAVAVILANILNAKNRAAAR